MKKILSLSSIIIGFLFSSYSYAAKVNTCSQSSDNDTPQTIMKKANQGDACAQFDLGYMYSNGRGVKQNYTEALKWYELSAKQGIANAQYNLARLYYFPNSGVKQNYTQALKWYKLASEQGHSMAQYNLGYMYDEGQGTKKDYVNAAKWYTASAENGIIRAVNSLAILYYQGKGVKKDIDTAKMLFNYSCENGSPEGCDNYKLLNELGY